MPIPLGAKWQWQDGTSSACTSSAHIPAPSVDLSSQPRIVASSRTEMAAACSSCCAVSYTYHIHTYALTNRFIYTHMHTLRRDSIRLLRKRCPECLEKFTQCSIFILSLPHTFSLHIHTVAHQKFTLTSAQAPAIKICSTTPVCLSNLLERRRSIENKQKRKKKKY